MSLIWTDASLEPKRKFKYLISFGKFPEIKFLAQTCDRPGIKVANTEHKYFDKTYNHPGRVTWEPNPLSIKLVDIQKKGSSQTDTNERLLEIFSQSGLQYFANDGDFRTIGKDSAVSALGLVTITVLDSLTNAGTGNTPENDDLRLGGQQPVLVAEKWTLHNSWLESIKPDGLDYGSDDILTVTIQVRYDFAKFQDRLNNNPLKITNF
jgi:hypothetical protein